MNLINITGTEMKMNYSEKIRDIALNTFEVTCYMFPLEEWEIDDPSEISKPGGSTRSIVHFEGAATGGMVIDPSEDLLEAIAANMLGEDVATDEEKEGALCEIANIICGNTVPLFSKNEVICTISPPRIAGEDEDTDTVFKDMNRESLQVLLDEGTAEITLYYSED